MVVVPAAEFVSAGGWVVGHHIRPDQEHGILTRRKAIAGLVRRHRELAREVGQYFSLGRRTVLAILRNERDPHMRSALPLRLNGPVHGVNGNTLVPAPAPHQEREDGTKANR